MPRPIETICPECGSFAVIDNTDGSIHCQKQKFDYLVPGTKIVMTKGGGCGKVTEKQRAANSGQ